MNDAFEVPAHDDINAKHLATAMCAASLLDAGPTIPAAM